MTTTDTGTGALEAMLAHHAALADGLARRVGALRAAVESQDHHETAAAELVAYLAKEVLPHAMAEEHTLYQAAAAKEDLAETVAGMVDEHRRLVSLAERLATSGNGAAAVAEAGAIDALFAGHVAKENELILPPLAGDDAVDLAGLLVQMHRLTEAAQDETSVAEDAATPDAEATLLRLLLGAAGELVDAGRGDAACRLAAEAWVAVRALAPAQRHEKIFATYGALGPGTVFVLVNDHDPKPLRYQFEAQHAGHYSWDYLAAGPDIWRVRIGRPAGTPV